MKLKQLTVREVPLMYEGGQLFLEEAKFPEPFNSEAFGRNWRTLIAANLGEVWAFIENEKIVGAIGMAFLEDPFMGTATAFEHFWWVHPDQRKSRVGLDLWHKFEERAKERGCKRMVMVHLASLNLQHVFERRGYRLADQTFWKEI